MSRADGAEADGAEERQTEEINVSHHFDTKRAKSDPSMNICDTYVFKGSPGTTVMAMTVNADAQSGLEGVKKSTKAWGSEKPTELAGFSRNTDRVFVTGDTAAAVTLQLISRQPAMSPTGFSDSHRDRSGCVAAFVNCG